MIKLVFPIFSLLALGNGFTIQPRVVNGVLSNTTNFPFFVMIEQVMPPTRCSATLISDRWVLTAAHCVEKDFPKSVNLGIRSNGTYEVTVLIGIPDVHMYSMFSDNRRLYDIALIKLPHAIELRESIQPIILPKYCIDTDEAGLSLFAAGIGQTYASQRFRDLDGLLRQVAFKTFALSEYNVLLEDDNSHAAPSIILAGSHDNSDTGAGDSGGPVFLERDGTLVGVIRSTLVYDTGRLPTQIFTKVSHFFDWISYKTKLKLPKCKEQALILP